MTTIDWTRGDKPLPLHVPMDLTGATVEVHVREADTDAQALISPNPTGTITAAVTGDLTVTGAFLDVVIRYRIEVQVSQGGVVATFPNAEAGPTYLNIQPDVG